MKYTKISRLAVLSLFLVLPSMSAFAAETYYTDQGHTEVLFSWNHAGVSIQSGEFTMASGKLSLDPDDVGQSTIDVTIDANSLSTGFGPLDTDLKSKNFLDVESFPQITFKSTKVTKTGENTADVTGDLTIHGVTKPATLKTTMTHRGDHPVAAVIDYYKGKWVAFTATTEIDHQAFGVGPFSTGPITISIVTEMKDREN
ncbi:MAG: YceI family protein [Sneathiella sp.]